MRNRIVLPGEQVAVSEEYMPGEGTYESGGKIYASSVGTLELDTEDMIARVKAFNPPLELKVGDLVIAVVDDIRGTMAIAKVVKVQGKEREITGETEASLHISKISEGYTQDIRRELRIGDIIRARVIQVKPSLQLATSERYLGVVKALCSKCRSPMIKRGRELYCESCERTEPRKIAPDYDNLKLDAKE